MATIIQRMQAAQVLPRDADEALLVGRAWVAGEIPGPSPVLVRDGQVLDLSRLAPTMAQLLDLDGLPGRLRSASGLPAIGSIEALHAATVPGGAGPRLLAPVDLQPVKASGVTFVQSLMERVIEEQARGDPSKADAIRARIDALFGGDLGRIRPGSAEAS